MIKVAEPTPLDGTDVRLFRCGMLAHELVRVGHDVTWWHSTVHHQKKVQRYATTTTVPISDSYRIIFLYAPLYVKNIGLQRIINQVVIARAFRHYAQRMPRPDVILCCLPPLELCREAVRYGRRNGIPVIVDVQDLWPDAFLAFAPRFLRPLWKQLLLPWFHAVQEICRNATAVTGTTDAFVAWALGYAGRQKTRRDKPFPLAYQSREPDAASIRAAEYRWRDRGLPLDGSSFIACFLGLFGRHYELELVIEAARRLRAGGRQCTFVLCGSGDKLETLKHHAREDDHIIFPGWIGEADIWILLRKSAVGLCPYRMSATLAKNIPNKPIEYFSAGLPVVSSLRGELERLLENHRCGITYAPGDIEALVRILSDLYDHPDKRQQLGANAHRLFHEQFAAENVYPAMVRYIEEIRRAYLSNVTHCRYRPR